MQILDKIVAQQKKILILLGEIKQVLVDIRDGNSTT